MADSKDKNLEQNGPDDAELSDILGQLNEQPDKAVSNRDSSLLDKDIIRKPTGAEDQPEDLDGLLEKITEQPTAEVASKKPGFFRRLLNLFR